MVTTERQRRQQQRREGNVRWPQLKTNLLRRQYFIGTTKRIFHRGSATCDRRVFADEPGVCYRPWIGKRVAHCGADTVLIPPCPSWPMILSGDEELRPKNHPCQSWADSSPVFGSRWVAVGHGWSGRLIMTDWNRCQLLAWINKLRHRILRPSAWVLRHPFFLCNC